MRFSIIIILLFALSLPLFAQTNEGTAAFVNALQARQQGSIETAVSLFRQAAEDKRFVLGDYAQFEIGETYFSSGEYSAAVPEYFKVVTNYPKSLLLPKANLLLGKSYFNLKNFPRAIKTFQYLVRKYPEAKEAAEARFLIAKALELQKKWKEASLAYEETDLYHPLSYFGKKSRLAIKALKKTHKNMLRKGSRKRIALIEMKRMDIAPITP